MDAGDLYCERIVQYLEGSWGYKVGAKLVAIMVATATFADRGAAHSMDLTRGQDWCRVSGASKLAADIGYADGLCAEIARALQAVPTKPVTVEVDVQSPFLASASVTMSNGRKLPAIKVGSSDNPLSRRSVRMLAETIAARVSAQAAE